MRKITLILFALLVTIVAYCGAPQAINYQAVALGSNGQPLQARSIALRLSILAGGPSGQVSYQERQLATTDNAGTVSLQIGSGIALSGTFTSIDWSKGTYFLQTEIDTAGGTSYQTVGNVQFFSVPFALYADRAGRADLASQDYPDGLSSINPVRQDGSFTYVVPSGQSLYITQISSNGSPTCNTFDAQVGGGVSLVNGLAASGGSGTGSGSPASTNTRAQFPIVVPGGQTVSSTSCGTALSGFTVSTGYQFIMFDLSTGSYTVPSGYIFVIKNLLANASAGWNGYYSVNGLQSTYSSAPTYADQGDVISASGLSGKLLLMGYLKHK